MENQSSLKAGIGLLLLAALAIGIYFTLQSSENDYGSIAAVHEDSVLDSSLSAPLHAGVKSVDKTSDAHQVTKAVSNEVVTIAGNPAQAAVVKSWMEARGHYGPDDGSLNEYKAYDLETLERLADAGDLKAMVALSWLYLSPEQLVHPDSLIKYERILHKAALYGSTEALGSLSMHTAKLEPGTREVKRENLLEAFAWAHVGTLRGDMYPSENAMSDARIHDFEFTDAAIAQIKSRAHEIYNQLEQERIEMGLGKFDNSRPPEVDNLFKNLGGFMPIPE
jgi:hypothetical protein